MSAREMTHRFVRAMPDRLDPGILYVSLDYLTTSHLCACGCGEEVVLPLHPTKWRVTFDGHSVSMNPSIGSRALACRSHYWIDRGRVRWAEPMDDHDYARALANDLRADGAWHGRGAPSTRKTAAETPATSVEATRPSPMARLVAFAAGLFGRSR